MTAGFDLREMWDTFAGYPAEVRFPAAPAFGAAIEAAVLRFIDEGRPVPDVIAAKALGAAEALRAAASSHSIAEWTASMERNWVTDPVSDVEQARRQGGIEAMRAVGGLKSDQP